MPDSTFIPERLFGIIGHPLGHSLSPLIHNHCFQSMGVKAAYMAWDTPPDKLDAFMAALRALPISGASVTIPHKTAVMDMADVVSARAKAVGAANTLYFDGPALVAENTDVAGFTAPLRDMATLPPSALVLGAGGASRAVVHGLKELGVTDVAISNRTREKAEIIADDFKIQAVSWEDRHDRQAELVVNTTPLGMAGKTAGLSPLDPDSFSPDQIAYDIVYNPLETPFLEQARQAGCRTVDGLAMFVGQAAEQFRLFTGLDMPTRKVRALLTARL